MTIIDNVLHSVSIFCLVLFLFGVFLSTFTFVFEGSPGAFWEAETILWKYPGDRTHWLDLQQGQLSAGNTTQVQQGWSQDLW